MIYSVLKFRYARFALRYVVKNQTFALIEEEVGQVFEEIPFEGILGLAFPSMSAHGVPHRGGGGLLEGVFVCIQLCTMGFEVVLAVLRTVLGVGGCFQCLQPVLLQLAIWKFSP